MDEPSEPESGIRFMEKEDGIWLLRPTGPGTSTLLKLCEPDQNEEFMDAAALFLAAQDYGE